MKIAEIHTGDLVAVVKSRRSRPDRNLQYMQKATVVAIGVRQVSRSSSLSFSHGSRTVDEKQVQVRIEADNLSDYQWDTFQVDGPLVWLPPRNILALWSDVESDINALRRSREVAKLAQTQNEAAGPLVAAALDEDGIEYKTDPRRSVFHIQATELWRLINGD